MNNNIKKATPGLIITQGQMKRSRHSDYDILTQNNGKKVSNILLMHAQIL